MDEIIVARYRFRHICDIVPFQMEGVIEPYFPQQAYVNRDRVSLHSYGQGPFCRFRIPRIEAQGVYLIRISDTIRYVGECENLSNRFNAGYGTISPRNCFVGGQTTNCRINNNIYKMALNQFKIELFFLETHRRFEIESELITQLHPDWNISKGNAMRSTQSDTPKNDVESAPARQRPPAVSHLGAMGSTRASCRDEILSVVQLIVSNKGENRFTVAEVIKEMLSRKTPYQEATIRTHIVSRCCVNAPTHHATVFHDFERVAHGVYKLHTE